MEIEPTRIVGHIKRVTVDAPTEPGKPPHVRLIVDVSGFDGRRDLNGLVGLLSNITVQPVQHALDI